MSVRIFRGTNTYKLMYILISKRYLSMTFFKNIDKYRLSFKLDSIFGDKHSPFNWKVFLQN